MEVLVKRASQELSPQVGNISDEFRYLNLFRVRNPARTEDCLAAHLKCAAKRSFAKLTSSNTCRNALLDRWS